MTGSWIKSNTEVASRLARDPMVEAAGGHGAGDVFLAQRPSIARVVMLYWPYVERIVVVAGSKLTVIRTDLALSRCTSIESEYDLREFEFRRSSWLRKSVLCIGGKRQLVFRGAEAQRIVSRLSALGTSGN